VTAKKVLVVRFGGIGDFVSAFSYCTARTERDLFFSPSVKTLFLKKVDGQRDLLRLLPSSLSTAVYFGNICYLFKLIRLNEYSEVLIYAQSSDGYLLKLFTYVLRFVLIFKKIKVKKFFFGGQYIHLINECSQIKSLISNLPRHPNISIFFDSKETANNLDVATVEAICKTLHNFLKDPKISIYGLNRLEFSLEGIAVNNLSGMTTFDQLQKVFSNTHLAVTCDSGPFHVFLTKNIPCITFVSARQNLLNWTPAKPNVFYIFDDTIDCLGCGKAVCPKKENLCVNSEVTRRQFIEIFK
jgi:ADP-heptose:LPS heptosyltransferase